MPTATTTPSTYPCAALRYVDVHNAGPDQVAVTGANGRALVTAGSTARFEPAGHDLQYSANGLADVTLTPGPRRAVGLA